MVLTGAFMFGADLCRELYRLHNRNTRFYLIKTSVYDETIKAANEKYRAVKLELEPRGIKLHDILLIEDIIP
jgi:hypoxanthine-guanine phosphoribosyltransferase